ncbi:unnamed protein product [Gadus morhua 'NCC']
MIEIAVFRDLWGDTVRPSTFSLLQGGLHCGKLRSCKGAIVNVEVCEDCRYLFLSSVHCWGYLSFGELSVRALECVVNLILHRWFRTTKVLFWTPLSSLFSTTLEGDTEMCDVTIPLLFILAAPQLVTVNLSPVVVATSPRRRDLITSDPEGRPYTWDLQVSRGALEGSPPNPNTSTAKLWGYTQQPRLLHTQKEENHWLLGRCQTPAHYGTSRPHTGTL